VRGFETLVGGPAGIASDVSIITKPCEAILDGPYPIARLAGTTNSAARLDGSSHPYRPHWWNPASTLRVLRAARIPHHARVGVGAVQNRRQNHRVVSTVGGDAGRPAHQRHETPRCARHHDAPIPTPLHHHDRRSPPRRLPQQM
jgi:hypothetical protein